MPERDLLRARADIGMVFQELALFDSLTVVGSGATARKCAINRTPRDGRVVDDGGLENH
jgi:ABC-type polar amino acid transport system ATPase subunit